MRKVFLIFLAGILLTGCGDISNTPTRQVERYFNKYQILDQDVLYNLDSIIDSDSRFNNTNKDNYREVIKKQYKNLSYMIKEERIDGDNAVVTVEITVLDFAQVLSQTQDYRNNNMDEFKDDSGNYSEILYTNYVIDRLENTNEKVKYTLDMELNKVDGKWVLENIDSDTEDKILGIYQK